MWMLKTQYMNANIRVILTDGKCITRCFFQAHFTPFQTSSPSIFNPLQLSPPTFLKRFALLLSEPTRFIVGIVKGFVSLWSLYMQATYAVATWHQNTIWCLNSYCSRFQFRCRSAEPWAGRMPWTTCERCIKEFINSTTYCSIYTSRKQFV